MKVVNLFGGPSSGKSTSAAGAFYHMKMLGLNVELVTEFAKDLNYSGQIELLLDQQEYIFAEQNIRQHRLRDKVDYAITDSPIILGNIYANQDWTLLNMFQEFALATYHSYENINILLQRPPPETFTDTGRRQDLAESVAIDNAILKLLQDCEIPHDVVQTGPNTVADILEIVAVLSK